MLQDIYGRILYFSRVRPRMCNSVHCEGCDFSQSVRAAKRIQSKSCPPNSFIAMAMSSR